MSNRLATLRPRKPKQPPHLQSPNAIPSQHTRIRKRAFRRILNTKPCVPSSSPSTEPFVAIKQHSPLKPSRPLPFTQETSSEDEIAAYLITKRQWLDIYSRPETPFTEHPHSPSGSINTKSPQSIRPGTINENTRLERRCQKPCANDNSHGGLESDSWMRKYSNTSFADDECSEASSPRSSLGSCSSSGSGGASNDVTSSESGSEYSASSESCSEEDGEDEERVEIDRVLRNRQYGRGLSVRKDSTDSWSSGLFVLEKQQSDERYPKSDHFEIGKTM